MGLATLTANCMQAHQIRSADVRAQDFIIAHLFLLSLSNLLLKSAGNAAQILYVMLKLFFSDYTDNQIFCHAILVNTSEK